MFAGFFYYGRSTKLTNFPRRGSRSGDIDLAGGKKSGFYQRAAYWRTDPVLQLFVFTGEQPQNAWQSQPALLKWNWPDGAKVMVRAATNCDEVELFLNNRSLGRKPVSLYFNDWNVEYQPGELKAVGYNKGIKVAASNLVTAGAATKLQFTPLPISISSDVLLFEVTVTDKAGINVVDAKDAVTLKVEGNGKLIGLDNGELDYTGEFKTNTRNVYQGRLLVSVQKTSSASGISVTATAPGLSSAILQAK